MLLNRPSQDDPSRIVIELADTDPAGAPPDFKAQLELFATLADIRRIQSTTPWVWEGWIPSNRIIGIGAFEGSGKTRLA